MKIIVSFAINLLNYLFIFYDVFLSGLKISNKKSTNNKPRSRENSIDFVLWAWKSTTVFEDILKINFIGVFHYFHYNKELILLKLYHKTLKLIFCFVFLICSSSWIFQASLIENNENPIIYIKLKWFTYVIVWKTAKGGRCGRWKLRRMRKIEENQNLLMFLFVLNLNWKHFAAYSDHWINENVKHKSKSFYKTIKEFAFSFSFL